jgi:hypothetical protein
VQPKSGDLFAFDVKNNDTNTQTTDKFTPPDAAADLQAAAAQAQQNRPLMRRPSRQPGNARTW